MTAQAGVPWDPISVCSHHPAWGRGNVLHGMFDHAGLSIVPVQKLVHAVGHMVQTIPEVLVQLLAQLVQFGGDPLLCLGVRLILHPWDRRGPGVRRIDRVLPAGLGVDCPLVHDQCNVSEVGVGNVLPGHGDARHGEPAQSNGLEQFVLRQVVQCHQVLGFLHGGLHGEFRLYFSRYLFIKGCTAFTISLAVAPLSSRLSMFGVCSGSCRSDRTTVVFTLHGNPMLSIFCRSLCSVSSFAVTITILHLDHGPFPVVLHLKRQLLAVQHHEGSRTIFIIVRVIFFFRNFLIVSRPVDLVPELVDHFALSQSAFPFVHVPAELDISLRRPSGPVGLLLLLRGNERGVQNVLGRFLHAGDPVEDIHAAQAVTDDLVPDVLRGKPGFPVSRLILVNAFLEPLVPQQLPGPCHGLVPVDLALFQHVVAHLMPGELLRRELRVIRPYIQPVPIHIGCPGTGDPAVLPADGKIPAAEEGDLQSPAPSRCLSASRVERF